MARYRFVLLAAILLAACCRVAAPVPLGLADGPYRVHRVIDGDTVILHNVGPLRFAGIDAPELGTAAGEAARAELAARIEGRVVQVEFVRRKTGSGQGAAGTVVRDCYGRFLGRIRLR